MSGTKIRFVDNPQNNEAIDFSKTDMAYINDIDTVEIAYNLLHAADIDFDDLKDAYLTTEVDNALFHLKTTAQNKYNNDYFRILLYVLTKISENVNNYFVS